MRVFKSKPFARFARKGRIADATLWAAISDIEKGRVDADLGGGVIKQRIARQGGGKSGGFRALIVLRLGERAFFVHGFAKNERDNLRDDEVQVLKKLADQLAGLDEAALAKALADGALTEVTRHEEAIS